MSATVLYMSMSLDGFTAGRNDDFMATGAVVAGRGTFEPAGAWGGAAERGVCDEFWGSARSVDVDATESKVAWTTTAEGRRRVRNCSRYVDVPTVQAAAY